MHLSAKKSDASTREYASIAQVESDRRFSGPTISGSSPRGREARRLPLYGDVGDEHGEGDQGRGFHMNEQLDLVWTKHRRKRQACAGGPQGRSEGISPSLRDLEPVRASLAHRRPVDERYAHWGRRSDAEPRGAAGAEGQAARSRYP